MDDLKLSQQTADKIKVIARDVLVYHQVKNEGQSSYMSVKFEPFDTFVDSLVSEDEPCHLCGVHKTWLCNCDLPKDQQYEIAKKVWEGYKNGAWAGMTFDDYLTQQKEETSTNVPINPHEYPCYCPECYNKETDNEIALRKWEEFKLQKERFVDGELPHFDFSFTRYLTQQKEK